MNRELILVVEQLAREKGIDPEILFEAVESALLSGSKKTHATADNSRIEIDRKTGELRAYTRKKVVTEVTDAALEAYQASGAKTENLAYAQLVDLRVGFYAEAGNPQSAIPEVNAMVDDLAARGANASVVAELRSLAPEPPPTPRTRKVTKSPRKRPAKKTPKRN